jgi:hypothetical protein
LHKVGKAELSYICLAENIIPGASLSSSQSLSIWSSITTAAQSEGFKPMNGTVAEATVINATNFTWDGTNLAFLLAMDDVKPPPPGGP